MNSMELNKIYNEDCLETLGRMPDRFIDCCITSPPYYGLRDYGHDGQVGLEDTPEKYVEKLVEIFREVRRVLKDDGTLYLNLGDSYAGGQGCGNSDMSSKQTTNKGAKFLNGRTAKMPNGLKPKDLIGIPWRVAFALQADGWYLRQDIIWSKPNPMPESVKDRCTKSHEYIFMLAKSQRYYYNQDAIKEKSTEEEMHSGIRKRDRTIDKDIGIYPPRHNPQHLRNTYGKRYPMRNKRSVWTVNTQPFGGAHFAVFPEKLIEPCVLAGCREDGIIYDPFMGAGTAGLVAIRAGRSFIGSELNPEYCDIANKRLAPYLAQEKLF